MAEWFVAKAAEMSDGDRRIVSAGRHEIGVFCKDGALHAYSKDCWTRLSESNALS